jgi:tRNA nucleotidyltransferase (CCA-adding enzyme)
MELRDQILKVIQMDKPSQGMQELRSRSDFPRVLRDLIGCEQNPLYHPEGDVWTHTCNVLDYFAVHRVHDDREDMIVGLACLCHDLGKPEAKRRQAKTIEDDGFYHAHDIIGGRITRRFLSKLGFGQQDIEDVANLVENHMVDLADCSESGLRRVGRRVQNIQRLIRLRDADSWGRGITPSKRKQALTLKVLDRLEQMRVQDEKPVPLVMGRHLLAFGVPPGKEMGDILQKLFDIQLAGRFSTVEDGIALWRSGDL